jgi:hypothetical protein
VVKATISPPLDQVALERYNVPNIALDPKSGEDCKFQFSYFLLRVIFLRFLKFTRKVGKIILDKIF